MKTPHRHTAAQVLNTCSTLDELMAEYEENALTRGRAEIAAEDAAWAALPQAEKDRRLAAMAARFPDISEEEE